MAIKFSCPECAHRFKVNDRLAGQKGRCHACQHLFRIPACARSKAEVAATGRYRLGAIPEAKLESNPQKVVSIPSQVGLAPVSKNSVQRIEKIEKRWVEEESGPYNLPKMKKKKRRKSPKPPGAMKEFYWERMRGLRRFLGGLNDFGYLITIPFITLIMISIIWAERDWAVMGATGIVLINIVRFYINLAALALLPFRESVTQGIMFLIPPLTLIYLSKHWKRTKNGAKKLVGPVFQIVAVVLAFIFIPVLNGAKLEEGATLKQRMNAEIKVLEKDVKRETQELKTKSKTTATKVMNETKQELLNRGVDTEQISDEVRQKTEDALEAAQKEIEELKKKLKESSLNKE